MKRVGKKMIGSSIVIASLIWGVVLRLYGITQESFWIDESYSIAIAQAITEHGYPLLDSGLVIWRSPVYHYILAGVMAVFGNGELATRILSVVLSLIAIGLVWKMADRWITRRAAWVSVVIMSLSYWQIAWARQARMYMLLLIVFWLSVYIFNEWINAKPNQRTWKQWLWVPLTVLAIGVHPFAALLLPAYAVRWYLQAAESHRASIRYSLGYGGVVIGSTVVCILLLTTLGYSIPVNYWSNYLQFLTTEYLTAMFLSGYAIVILIRFSKHKAALWLLAILMIGLGVFSYGVTLVHYRYLFFLTPVIIMLASFAIEYVGGFRWMGIIAVSILFIGSTELHLNPQEHWPLESDPLITSTGYSSFTPQPDFKEAYTYIQEQSPEFLVTPYPTISRLYGVEDDYSLPIDLIGTRNWNSEPERYTGITAITEEIIIDQHRQEKSIYILVDYFALRRMQPELRKLIENEGELLYSSHSETRRELTLYQL